VSTFAFGISLGANVVLLAGLLVALSLFWLSQAGAFAPSGANTSGQPAPAGSAHGVALSSPTATASPVASPTPSTGWLQVNPSGVQLGCGDGQQVQSVQLQNTGPQIVDWQVTFFDPQQQAGVMVDPEQGELDTGDSVSVQVQTTLQWHGGSNQLGIIDFTPTLPDAGPPARLTFTIVGCQ
jgi:hypothetical protein